MELLTVRNMVQVNGSFRLPDNYTEHRLDGVVLHLLFASGNNRQPFLKRKMRNHMMSGNNKHAE